MIFFSSKPKHMDKIPLGIYVTQEFQVGSHGEPIPGAAEQIVITQRCFNNKGKNVIFSERFDLPLEDGPSQKAYAKHTLLRALQKMGVDTAQPVNIYLDTRANEYLNPKPKQKVDKSKDKKWLEITTNKEKVVINCSTWTKTRFFFSAEARPITPTVETAWLVRSRQQLHRAPHQQTLFVIPEPRTPDAACADAATGQQPASPAVSH